MYLCNLEESRVDDVEDAVDGEARLGDVGGHDDLPLSLGRVLEDLALRLKRHGRVDGQHHVLALRHSSGEKHTVEAITSGCNRNIDMIAIWLT